MNSLTGSRAPSAFRLTCTRPLHNMKLRAKHLRERETGICISTQLRAGSRYAQWNLPGPQIGHVTGCTAWVCTSWAPRAVSADAHLHLACAFHLELYGLPQSADQPPRERNKVCTSVRMFGRHPQHRHVATCDLRVHVGTKARHSRVRQISRSCLRGPPTTTTCICSVVRLQELAHPLVDWAPQCHPQRRVHSAKQWAGPGALRAARCAGPSLPTQEILHCISRTAWAVGVAVGLVAASLQLASKQAWMAPVSHA